MVGVVVMLFLFATTFSAQKSIIINAASMSGPLLTAVLYSIPAVELIMILGAPFMLEQKKYEREAAKRRRSR